MLYPLNKHLVVEPIEEQQDQTQILIPDGVRIDLSKYKIVKLKIASINSILEKGMFLVAPAHTIEEVSFADKKYYLVLENHVVGYLDHGGKVK